MLAIGESKAVFALGSDPVAADIILLVDESGSMKQEQTWLPLVATTLNNALKDIGIGTTLPNLFGVTGFGSFHHEDIAGHLLAHNDMALVNASYVEQLSLQLTQAGKYEDGYAAMDFAAHNYNFRERAAKHLIIITDEERNILNSSLLKDDIVRLLWQNNLT